MTMAESKAVPASAHRFILPEFLSPQECKELEFIHRSCGVFGYRPFVLSTTLSHLVATNCAHLILPILPVRERVKEAVEEYFGREYELFVEFTGLISWTKGANIGWHSDDNRSYLRQRHYSAVCYLNNYERDFKGGLFRFQDGEPSTISPYIGVTEGERCTLALWFSADRVHDEDQKLIQQISVALPDLQAHPFDEEPGNGWSPFYEIIVQTSLKGLDLSAALFLSAVLAKLPCKQNAHHPIAASSVMYKAQNLQNEADQLVEGSTIGELANPYFNTTDDLRIVRLAQLGFSCCFSCTAVNDQHDNPVVLTYKHKEVPYLFSSSLEALQVAQFHQFKPTMIQNFSPGFSGQMLVDSRQKSMTNAADSSHFEMKAGHFMTETTAATAFHDCGAPLFNQDDVRMEYQVDVNGVSASPCKADHGELDDFLDSVQQFEAYTSDLWRKLFQSFPSWRTTGSLLLSDL